MTEDNTIDLGHRLPPLKVRKPWRQTFPYCYSKRIEALKATLKDVGASCSDLADMRREFQDGAESASGDHAETLNRVVDEISAAIVLLKCAQDRLIEALPVEEFMDQKSLAEFWDKQKR